MQTQQESTVTDTVTALDSTQHCCETSNVHTASNTCGSIHQGGCRQYLLLLGGELARCANLAAKDRFQGTNQMSQNLGKSCVAPAKSHQGPQLPASCSLAHITNIGDPISCPHLALPESSSIQHQLAVCFTRSWLPLPAPRVASSLRSGALLTLQASEQLRKEVTMSIWQVRLSRLDSAGETCRRSSVQVFFALKTGP